MKTLEKQSLFWDVDLGTIDPQTHKTFIVKRILSMGDIDDLNWAFQLYGAEILREIFLKSIDQFDAKSRNFWKVYFNISDQILCTTKQSMSKQCAFLKR
ncbi:MAG: hypothetical protein US57_C0011G0045 [Candidatus Moranbacteria bacterium GW2011_GWC2_37_73]|nr:MAG: hypothetical protein UR95_C0006G0134 [Parcubacteria group bacterium GW2011_GWC1_36_108]KKQ00144.1 MAG: hypothetical protein US09_C0019G0004 [Candidatus Moranbacteria bacterium GW2011_GWD1_36_198]KKQ00210.1 MAG: hypothetical protein US10_C0038G0018 [Candidatus Moranbacteria bacterium GW2011_GWD2_36_198]KKQ39557.1 MAG: hypothetical protein US57_C0011G0045 [Candidatus Moranbacteria bacterium GW2011_GWC2_37_73]HAS00107.1 hypothetical protein [Candidatus Moranbacteria bacterium]